MKSRDAAWEVLKKLYIPVTTRDIVIADVVKSQACPARDASAQSPTPIIMASSGDCHVALRLLAMILLDSVFMKPFLTKLRF
jgi:hypothetical protein